MKFFGALLLFFFSCSLVAQINPIRNYTINDGLPSNSIKSIFRDSKGILWVGTTSGITSFNGIDFHYYADIPGYKYAEVWSICEDEEKNLWFSFYGEGVAKYDGSRFTFFSEKNGLSSNFVRKLHYSKQFNCLVAATEKGLSFLPHGSEAFIHPKDSLLSSGQFMDICEDTNELNSLSSTKGMQSYTKNSFPDGSNVHPSKSGYSLLNSSDALVIGRGSRQLIFNDKRSKEKLFSVNMPSIPWDLVEDATKNIYAATWDAHYPRGTVYRFSPNKQPSVEAVKGLPNKGFWCLYYDSLEHQLWAGSITNGLYAINLNQEMSRYDKEIFDLEEAIVDEVFVDNQHRTWVGTKNAISVLKNDSLVKQFKLEDLYQQISILAHAKLKSNPFSTDRKSAFRCYNFHTDKNNNIYVNSSLGVLIFDPDYNLIFYKNTAGGQSFIDSKGAFFYIQNYRPIHKILNKDMWEQAFVEFSLKDKNNPRSITKVLTTKNSAWLASTYHGVYYYTNDTFVSLLNKGVLAERGIKDLAKLDTSSVVVTAHSGNVYIVNAVTQQQFSVTKLNFQKEVQDAIIHFVQTYQNYLFIGSTKGVHVFEADKFIKTIPFDFDEEIIMNTAKVDNHSKSLLIGTNKGLVKIAIPSVMKNTTQHQSSIVPISLTINGSNHQLPKRSSDVISLNYTQNEIELFFQGSNLINAMYNVYRFKIKGLSDDWSKYYKENAVKIMGLRPGKYEIQIQGRNSVTGNPLVPYQLYLEVFPPFWGTWWFISLSIGVGLFLLVLFVRYRVLKNQKIKNQQIILSQQLTEAKLEALRAQMNPHFTFNAINSIQNFIIDADTQNALHYLGAFSKLIRQTLETATEKFVPLKLELDFLTNYVQVQQMRFDKIKVDWNIADTINLYKTTIPPLIIQPYIENVFEHAFDDSMEEQHLTVTFKRNANQLICEVADNGMGIEEGSTSETHISRGLKITKARFDLFNQELKTNEFKIEFFNLNENQNQQGTLIRIYFPLIVFDSL